MHELGLMTSVFDAVGAAARDAGATRVLAINLTVGEMTEALSDALEFAHQMLSEGDPFFEGSALTISRVPCKSRCNECGHEFEHARFEFECPACGSVATQLISGKEFLIDNIEVDIPDGPSAEGGTQ